MKKLSRFFNRLSTGKAAIAVTVIYILFMAIVLPMQSVKTKAALNGNKTPDMSFRYNAEKLYSMADSYGIDGREAYIKARYTFDIIWPLVYGVFFIVVISFIFNRESFKDGWKLLNLVPLGGVAFDFLENISTAAVMARYPIKTDILATSAPVFTLFKWTFISLSLSLIFIGGLVLVIQKISGKNHE